MHMNFIKWHNCFGRSVSQLQIMSFVKHSSVTENWMTIFFSTTCNYLHVTCFFDSSSLFNSLVWKLKAVTGWVDRGHCILPNTVTTLYCMNYGRLLDDFLFSNCSSLFPMRIIPLKMFTYGNRTDSVLSLSSIKHSQSAHTLLFIVFVSSSSGVCSSQR